MAEQMLSWEQKLDALNALSRCELCMRSPGDWYVTSGFGINEGHVIAGGAGNGNSPQAAVEAHWEKYGKATYDKPVAIFDHDTKAYRSYWWNGYMWREVSK